MNNGVHRFTVGKFVCTIVPDGAFAYTHPAAVLFANAPQAALGAALRDYHIDLASWQEYLSPYPSLVIDTGRQRVLVDTGAGNLGPRTGRLLPNLRAADIDPDSIDIVILTHGHADHIGGNVTSEGKLAFPRAIYLMWQSEWEFWTNDPDLSQLQVPDLIKEALIGFARRNLPPIAAQLELVGQECEIVPGIWAVAAAGHTPGHMALSIRSEGQQLLYLVDTVLHPIHVEHPEWLAAVDLLPEQTIATRQRLLKRAADESALVLAFHFPAPGLGRVVAQGDRWAWQASA